MALHRRLRARCSVDGGELALRVGHVKRRPDRLLELGEIERLERFVEQVERDLVAGEGPLESQEAAAVEPEG